MRWVLTSLLDTWDLPKLTTTTTSDKPNHLYLWWSYTPPIKAPINAPRRGGWCRIGEFWWKWPMNQIHQVEPGNTLTHTHIWPNWLRLQTRYGFFFPSLDPLAQHSVSPFFTWTAPDLPPVIFNCSHKRDGFPDPDFDPLYWLIWQYNGATVVQNNARIEVTCPAHPRGGGLVTKVPHDLRCAITRTEHGTHDLRASNTIIAQTLTVNSMPWNQPNCYRFWYDNRDNIWAIDRRVDGVYTFLGSGGWPRPPVLLEIEIAEGVIHFYAATRHIFSEPFALPTYSLYIYNGETSGGARFGMGYFDDFLLHKAWPS